MRKTNTPMLNFDDKLALDSFALAQARGCGKPMAMQIGSLAKAKIKIGKRVLWNVKKVQEYLDEISTE